jgi:hypothetical protein
LALLSAELLAALLEVAGGLRFGTWAAAARHGFADRRLGDASQIEFARCPRLPVMRVEAETARRDRSAGRT